MIKAYCPRRKKMKYTNYLKKEIEKNKKLLIGLNNKSIKYKRIISIINYYKYVVERNNIRHTPSEDIIQTACDSDSYDYIQPCRKIVKVNNFYL